MLSSMLHDRSNKIIIIIIFLSGEERPLLRLRSGLGSTRSCLWLWPNFRSRSRLVRDCRGYHLGFWSWCLRHRKRVRFLQPHVHWYEFSPSPPPTTILQQPIKTNTCYNLGDHSKKQIDAACTLEAPSTFHCFVVLARLEQVRISFLFLFFFVVVVCFFSLSCNKRLRLDFVDSQWGLCSLLWSWGMWKEEAPLNKRIPFLLVGSVVYAFFSLSLWSFSLFSNAKGV